MDDPVTLDFTDSLVDILDWFNDQPCSCATIGRITANVDWNRETVRRQMNKLRAAGVAERLHKPTGEYRLIEDPRDS